MSLLPAHHLKLYRNFKSIESSDFHGIVRYFERFEEDIRLLNFEEFFDCTVAYTFALFEIGAFRKHLVMSDFLLETIIYNNIQFWGGEDLYPKVLYKKAVATMQVGKSDEAAYIFREILKMYPTHRESSRLLLQCMLEERPRLLERVRHFSLFLILFSAASIAFTEIFVVRKFFPEWRMQGLMFSFGWLAVALLILGGAEAWHYLKIRRQVKIFCRACFHRKYNS